MMQHLYLQAPAKINLTLDVLGRRADGYHELATTMHQIDWADTVALEKAAEGVQLEHDHAMLPKNEENLAFRAAQAVKEFTGITSGVRIIIRKRIPLEAGLAGGSTDAAAVIRGMNTLFDLQLTTAEMCGIGESLGADVPFCVQGGTAFCTGRGEIIQTLPDDGLGLIFVLVKPSVSLATAMVFSRFESAKVQERPQEALFQKAWRNRELLTMLPALGNVLETVSAELEPEIAEIKHQLLSLGALASLMSGSGSAVFGIFVDEAAALQAATTLKNQYPEVRLCRSFIRSAE